MAKALAGESGVPFIQASASEFIEMFVGQWAKHCEASSFRVYYVPAAGQAPNDSTGNSVSE